MNRRDFLKYLAAGGAAVIVPIKLLGASAPPLPNDLDFGPGDFSCSVWLKGTGWEIAPGPRVEFTDYEAYVNRTLKEISKNLKVPYELLAERMLK